MSKKIKQLFRLLGIAAFSITLAGCANSITQPVNSNHNQISKGQSANNNDENTIQDSSYGGITNEQKKTLATWDYQSGKPAIIQVNDGKSTLNPQSWKTNKIIYSNLDQLNRTSSPNTGFLEKRNHANSALRVRQTVAPTGWHYNHGENQIYNRGHLISYSVSAGISQDGRYDPNSTSGDQNNPKNLFTQSAFSNQKLQTIYEDKVRTAIGQNKKVIYQVTPIFRGDELMARGVNLQAISTDSSLNFNVYIFNVQPGIVFSYANGSNRKDTNMNVPTPQNAPTFNNNSRSSNQRSNNRSYPSSNSLKHWAYKHARNWTHNNGEVRY